MHKLKSTESISEFLEYRKNLSDSDKKVEAGLVIEEVRLIDVDSAFGKVRNRIDSHHKISRVFTWLTRVAAIITIPLLAFTIWNLTIRDSSSILTENEITWQEIQSPLGLRSHIVLPDGSDLWLNAGSVIRYGIPFIRENRHVDLIGEAFLSVVKNDKAPFVVNIGDTKVKVLGTQFNVKGYPEDNQIEVALIEGGVEFYFTKKDGNKVFTKLKPNDYLVLNRKNKTIVKNNKNLDKYIGWHQNMLIFDDTPMMEVASVLKRWYGVKVVIDNDEIKKYKFTTTFENEPLFRVLELLERSSPIKVKYIRGKFNKKTNTVAPIVVTITHK